MVRILFLLARFIHTHLSQTMYIYPYTFVINNVYTHTNIMLSGCFALTCPGCGCGFCAACILDCGDDAHEHCRQVHQGYFGTLERFNAVQRHKRLRDIVRYLKELQEGPPFIEALLNGHLQKDLSEVDITTAEVRGVLTGNVKLSMEEGQRGSATAIGGQDNHRIVPVRLQYSQEDAHRQYRLVLDGPGYPAEHDAISKGLGTVVSAAIMMTGVWWLTKDDTADLKEDKIAFFFGDVEATKLFVALIVGPSVLMLGTGRVRQLLQALYVTALTSLLCLPLYFFAVPMLSW